MSTYAEKCDLAFTLASSLSIELIAREVPLGVAYAFDNQEDGFHELVSLSLALPIGERDIQGNWIFDKDNLTELIISASLRNQLRSRMSGLIDFKGAERVALEILKL
jgi:hypothetical protein